MRLLVKTQQHNKVNCQIGFGTQGVKYSPTAVSADKLYWCYLDFNR